MTSNFEKVGGLGILNIKTCYKTTVIKIVLRHRDE